MYQVVKNILALESKLMTRDKQFRNSRGWKANKSSYWYNLGAKQEFIQELFIPLRRLRKMFGEQNRGGLWSRFGRYSYYLKCERGIK